MGIENPVHLLFIAIVALVVLGPKRLPELAKALGHGIREFREAVNTGASEPPPPPVAAAAAAPPPPVAATPPPPPPAAVEQTPAEQIPGEA
jgi:sec-independent protein translocase protein TatA